MSDFTRPEQVPHLGAVSHGLAIPSASFTRLGDTTTYAPGDLVANHGTAGSVVPLSLSLARYSEGATGRIKRVRLSKTNTGVVSAQFRVHFYGASPTPANGDNAAFSTNQAASYIGSVGVTIDRAFTDGAFGAADADLAFQVSAATLYALIEAVAAYPPGNAEVFTLKAEIEQG